jgi:putative zinc finger/helix-turn-helix YgiT family protein
MKCSNCKTGNAKRQRGLYRYDGSGLPDVFLKNVKWTRCDNCGETTVDIPRLSQLHRCIAWMVVMKNSYLTPEEMVFLRKMLGKRQGEMATILGIDQVALNRWERGKRTGRTKASDTLFRLAYLAYQDDEYTHKISESLRKPLMQYFGHIRDEARPLDARLDPARCSTESVVEKTLTSLLSGNAAGAGHARLAGQ